MSHLADTRRVLARLGYLMGRFAYLADAADDLSDDLAKKRYNIFIKRNHLRAKDEIAPVLEDAKAQMRLTAAEAELCYRLLEPLHFRPILDNIMYKGLLSVTKTVGRSRKEKKENGPI
jgi:hypothetical protein